MGRIYALTLTLLTGDKTPEGPGWYIVSRADEGEQGFTFTKKVTLTQAQELGRAFGSAVTVEEGEIHPFEVISKGNEAAKTIIQEKLHEAEQIATQVGGLRKALGEFGG